MLNVSNLSLQFGKRVLFDEVNIKFTNGNCYGIIGANGAGKSTLLKIVAGINKPSLGNISAPKDAVIAYLPQHLLTEDNCSVREETSKAFAEYLSMKNEIDELNEQLTVRTDYESDDYMKLIERVSEVSEKFYSIEEVNYEAEVEKVLKGMGFAQEDLDRSTSEFSGGWRMRIELAKILLRKPDLILLDEPTNHLDIESIQWLEDFLGNFENTVIVVSHDRHFLDAVCTHICDLDFSKLNLYSGNYTFWYESSQLAAKQRAQQNKKAEEKKKELQDFIARFSSNVAKAKQTTSRKKMIEKLNIEDIKPSSRRYPALIWEQSREAGDQILEVNNLSASVDGEVLFKDANINLKKGDKIGIFSRNSKAVSQFFEILSGKAQPDSGDFTWGITTTQAYLPLDNTDFFKEDINLVDWLRQYTESDDERHEEFMRGFLGKMLFSGDEALKKSSVLSGGEKMRCMFSRMMLLRANVLLLDEPTGHLDLESITALNNSLVNFKGTILMGSHDHELIQTTCNRIIELTPNGIIDRYMTYDEFLDDPKVKELKAKYYA